MYEIFEKLLEERGITAYKISKETGVSTATLTSWKQGKYQPKREKLKAIADYFGVTMEYLMTGTDTSDQPTAMELTEQEEELLGIFRYLSNKEELLKYARFLKEGEKARSKDALDA